MIFKFKSTILSLSTLMGTGMRSAGVNKTSLFSKQDKEYGKDWNNLHQTKIDDIINGDYFSNDIVDS